jgi:hypothetical protein
MGKPSKFYHPRGRAKTLDFLFLFLFFRHGVAELSSATPKGQNPWFFIYLFYFFAMGWFSHPLGQNGGGMVAKGMSHPSSFSFSFSFSFFSFFLKFLIF